VLSETLKSRPVGEALAEEDVAGIVDKILSKKGLEKTCTRKLQKGFRSRVRAREMAENNARKLSLKRPTPVHPNRCMSVTKENVNKHFRQLKGIYDRLEITDPAQIVVMDEINITPTDKPRGLVYGVAGKRCYVATTDWNEHITYIGISRGNGMYLPGFTIWKGTVQLSAITFLLLLHFQNSCQGTVISSAFMLRRVLSFISCRQNAACSRQRLRRARWSTWLFSIWECDR
jgi:hypothetical protein